MSFFESLVLANEKAKISVEKNKSVFQSRFVAFSYFVEVILQAWAFLIVFGIINTYNPNSIDAYVFSLFYCLWIPFKFFGFNRIVKQRVWMQNNIAN